MTTEALRGTLQGPALISPSNLIRRIGESYSRYFLSSNPPPLNILREGPTQRDKEIANSGRNARPEEPKRGISSRDVFLVAGTSLTTAGAVIGGQILINRVFGAEPTPASRDIDSFGPNTFNPADGPRLVETKQVNPEEVFDPYKDIVSPTIDPKHPERINLASPIDFGPGSENRKLEIKFGQDNMGGGVRTIKRIDPATQKETEERIIVNSLFKIKEGVKKGDPLKSPIKCNPQLRCSIARGSSMEDKNGVVNPGGFHIRVEDGNGNFANLIMRTTPLKLTKDIPPLQIQRTGNSEYVPIQTYVPLENDEEIGIMVGSSKDPFTNAQIQILAFSTVVGEDGTRQFGPADIVVDSSSK